MSTPVSLSLANFQEGYCWKGPQQFATDLVNNLSGAVAVTGVLIQAGLPSYEQIGMLWARLDDHDYLEGVYTFLGVWARTHPVPAGGKERRIFIGTDAEVWAYDGGDGTNPASYAPTLTTGAMWEIDTTFGFKIPIGAGTNGTAYNGGAATTIAVQGTAGAEMVKLTADNLPEHKHVNPIVTSTAPDGQTLDETWQNLEGSTPASPTTRRMVDSTSATHANAVLPYTDMAGQPDASLDSVSVLPPVIGVYFIRRTSRKYITAT